MIENEQQGAQNTTQRQRLRNPSKTTQLRFRSTTTPQRTTTPSVHIHQLSSNTNAYATLLNSLILTRKERQNKLGKLKSVHPQRYSSTDEREHPEFRDIEEKTGKEWEISNNLER